MIAPFVCHRFAQFDIVYKFRFLIWTLKSCCLINPKQIIIPSGVVRIRLQRLLVELFKLAFPQSIIRKSL